jgi:hypothetical protein
MKEFSKERVIAGIAVSGYGTDEDVALSESCGFCFHLTKPITMEALEHAMAAVDEQVRAQ